MNNTIIYSIIGGIVLLILLIWIIIRRIRKRRKKLEIPEEVLNDFNELEERIKKNRTVMTPQQIMWQFYREKLNIQEEKIEEQKQKPNLNKLSNLFRKR